MYARWTSFALGLGLALGLLVCVGTLAALEWPAARFLLAAPGLGMIWMGRASTDPAAAVV